MFLVNSSVGSFAAAPTSLDTKVARSKEQSLNCHLSQKIVVVVKKDLITSVIVRIIFKTIAYAYSLTSLLKQRVL